MRATNMKKTISKTQLLLATVVALTLLLTPAAFAAAPGITGGTGATATFNLTARPAYITQPDGSAVYSWGYGCSIAPTGFAPALTGATCPTMQVPGPTMIVTQGQTVTVRLTNNLPPAAGNTSILFPGFNVTTGPLGINGLLTKEAGHATTNSTVTYTFVASTPGTHAYYSGTQGDLQVEMGLYGANHCPPLYYPRRLQFGSTCFQLDGAGFLGRNRFPARPRSVQPPGSLLRPGIPLPVLRDGSQDSPPSGRTGQ